MQGTYAVDILYPARSASATVGYLATTARAATCCCSNASRVGSSTGSCLLGPRWKWPAESSTCPSEAGGPDFSHGVSPVRAGLVPEAAPADDCDDEAAAGRDAETRL